MQLLREKICADKVNADGWLAIHEAAHKLGMHSNATMLYGHIEKPVHLVDHMRRLRELQDKNRWLQHFYTA
jgi:aminodeoxyfutalosine synthase